MRVSTSIATMAIALATSFTMAACGGNEPSGGPGTASVSGGVSAAAGAAIEGATVRVGSATVTTGADGRYELASLPVGNATIETSAPGFGPRSESVSLVEGTNTHDVVLTPIPTAAVSGVVTATTGAAIAGASVTIGTVAATTGADGRFELQNLPVGGTTIVTSAQGFAPRSESVGLIEGANTHDVVLAPAGEWGSRAPLLEPNSELAFAEANGKLYLLGGYPATRQTARTVQVYDIASDSWELGPPLPQPNNHGMAASVDGKIYLIGGQTSDVSDQGYVNTVYELDPARGTWVEKAPMPTARGAGTAVVHDGKIYVAGGRPPHGSDFAVYDPAADSWEVLPNMPTQRNHFTGAAIDGRIHLVGGRLGHGLSPQMTAAHQVFDPQTRTWTNAAPMLRARSGMNGVMARGCFHVWGGEGPGGMFSDHDYYDPRTDRWTRLLAMPTPVHGVYGSAFVGELIWVAGGGTNIGGNHGSQHNQVYRPEVSCE
jgi:N-acetylneuraminic acid mutarotase